MWCTNDSLYLAHLIEDLLSFSISSHSLTRKHTNTKHDNEIRNRKWKLGMRDYLPKYLNAFLLAFATFAVVFAIFIAKDPNISHHLYFSTSYSSQWTSSFSSAFITVSMSIFIPFHPHLDCNKCLKLQFNCLCYVSIYKEMLPIILTYCCVFGKTNGNEIFSHQGWF